MKIGMKYFFLFATVTTVLFFSGCLESKKAKGIDENLAKRFSESGSGKSAADVAMALSEKYATLVEKAAGMKENIKTLSVENKKLKEELGVTAKQLKKTEAELEDANELLLEMRIELNNWKTDVLGFRDEMRNAEQAQLEALMKIAEILGGETMESNQLIDSQEGNKDE